MAGNRSAGILIGTRNGVFEAEGTPGSQPEPVLSCGDVRQIRSFDGVVGDYVASEEGLYRVRSGTWNRISTPIENVWSIEYSGGNLFIGTMPSAVYRSADGGESWHELTGLSDVPGTSRWRSIKSPDSRIRTLLEDSASNRLFAGVEAGGLFYTDDGGENWHHSLVKGQEDIHQLIQIGPDEFVVACGRLSLSDRNHAAATGGLYRSTDTGETFTRIDGSIGPSYFREILHYGGTLYACGSFTIPPTWIGGLSAEAHVFLSDDLSNFEEVHYPGGPEAMILAWSVHHGRPIAGTSAGPVRGDGVGKVVAFSDGEWDTLCEVPSHIRTLQGSSESPE